MVLAYVVALLRKLLKNCFNAMIEARALRRDMAQRHPYIEQ